MDDEAEITAQKVNIEHGSIVREKEKITG